MSGRWGRLGSCAGLKILFLQNVARRIVVIFEHVVVLDKIMRQKDDPLLIEILKRLRKGLCNEEEKEILDKYVLSSEECSAETKDLTDIKRWVDDPHHACPLIVYTNVARDRHNLNMAEAFATATGQGCHVYHSRDTRGRGGNRQQLAGLAAEAAWAVPVKEANDLGGKVGAPEFISTLPLTSYFRCLTFPGCQSSAQKI